MTTFAIAGQIFWKRRVIKSILGEEHSKVHAGVITVLVESAALYSVVGITFIETYFSRNVAGALVQPLLGNLEASKINL
jgi:hypothetical protein